MFIVLMKLSLLFCHVGTWRPISFYDRIKYNQLGGMHTLCLLDIKVSQLSVLKNN
jgi:diphthamide biosynthesis methyltransferase